MPKSAIAVLGVALNMLPAVTTDAQEILWQELNAKASRLYKQGQYAEAATTAERGLRVAERTYGEEDLHTARSLNNVALLYQAQGMYDDAEPHFKRSLAITEQPLSPPLQTQKVLRKEISESP